MDFFATDNAVVIDFIFAACVDAFFFHIVMSASCRKDEDKGHEYVGQATHFGSL